MNTQNEHKADRNAPKAFWQPNYKADRIVYIALFIMAIALPLIFG